VSLLWIIIILAVILVLFGGVGYGYRDRWGGYYGGGVGLVVLLLVVVFVIWALTGFQVDRDGGGLIDIDL
jgi:hypothetical protein